MYPKSAINLMLFIFIVQVFAGVILRQKSRFFIVFKRIISEKFVRTYCTESGLRYPQDS